MNTRKRTTKKKRGGARGLVLNIMYNNNDEIIDIRLQDMLAVADYRNRNNIDPTYGPYDAWRYVKENFDFDRAFENMRDFLHQSETSKPKTKKKYVKLAVNDKRDIRLIQIANKIISVLNTVKNKTIQQPLLIIRENKKLTDKTKKEFRRRYEELLVNDFFEKVLETFHTSNKDTDRRKELVRRILQMPVIVNLVCIKYGLLKRGDLDLQEIQDIYNLDNDKVLEFFREEKKIDNTSYAQIVQEENEKLERENQELLEMIQQAKSGLSTSPEMFVVGGPALSDSDTDTSAPIGSSYEPQHGSLGQQRPAGQQPQQPKPQGPLKVIDDILTDDDDKERLDGIRTFNQLLLDKYTNSDESKKQVIQNNQKYFESYVQQNQNESPEIYKNKLQMYLIKNILACIGLNQREVFNKQNLPEDNTKFQAFCLLMIRVFLTKDMRNYTKFKQTFESNYNPSLRICESVTLAVNSLSLFGGIRTTYSYDTIVNNVRQNNSSCDDYELMITIHLNKLYDLFKTRDPAYIQQMITKSKSNGADTTTTGDYDETYEITNPNYIFS
jgi:hypothetical protein